MLSQSELEKGRYSTEIRLAVATYNRARYRRDNWIREAVRSRVLTRKEIAYAAGMSRSRVDQIARGE